MLSSISALDEKSWVLVACPFAMWWCSAPLELLSNSKLITPSMSTAASPELTAYTARFGRALLLRCGTPTDNGRLWVAILANSKSDFDGRSGAGALANKLSMLAA